MIRIYNESDIETYLKKLSKQEKKKIMKDINSGIIVGYRQSGREGYIIEE